MASGNQKLMLGNLLKANFVYAVGSVANSAALFLLVPYLVNAFTPEEYGAWSIFEVSILLLNMLMLVGLEVGFMREYWFLTDDTRQAELTGTVVLAASLWGGVLFISGVLLVSSGVPLPLPGTPFILIEILSIAWAEAILTLYLSLFRIREQATTFVTLSVSRMIAFVGLSVGLVHLGYGLFGALLGRLLATLLVLGGAVALGSRYITLCLNKDFLKRLIRYGLPLFPTNLASYILLASDRYILQHFSTLENAAIYTFAYKIAATLDVLITRPFELDWAPRRFKIAAQNDALRKYEQALLFYLWIAILFGLCVIVLTPLFYNWIAPRAYWSGMKLVPLILLAYLIYGLSYPLNVGIMLKGRTQYLPIIGWIAAVVCLGLNVWWIPRYGMWGAAWATIVAYGIWTGGIAWVSLQLYPIRYSLQRLGITLIAGATGYIGIQILGEVLEYHNTMIGALGLVWVLGVGSMSLLLLRRSL